MTRGPWFFLLTIAMLPEAAAAQSTVSGEAEWTVAQTDNTTDSQANSNGAFWQNYTVGYHSSIVDPRVLKYDTEVSVRTNRLTAASSTLADQKGRQNDLGFRLGAFVLPAGSFPFFVQASRVFTGSSGELTMGNSPVSGLALQSGAPIDAFETEERNLNLGGQLNVPGLPRAGITYRRGSAVSTGGTERAAQRNDDLSADVSRETPRTRQALRYQRSGYDYVLAQSFSQKVDNLDYDFSATVLRHVQLNARAGQRDTFAESNLGPPPVGLADRPYQPPPSTDGQSGAKYAVGGFSYEPNARVAVRFNGTWDHQRSSIASTSAGLGTGTVHVEVLRGLAVHGEATGGQRGQIVQSVETQVTTTNGLAGLTYTGGPRWLNGTATANVGQGTNQTPEGKRGATRSWAREVSLASSVGWFAVGAGYERMLSADAILDYGNYSSERSRMSLNLQSARISMNASADRATIIRGQGETLAHNRQDTFSTTLSGRMWREVMITGMAGGFNTTYLSAAGAGIDRSLFWGAGAQSALHRSLRAVAWIRSQHTLATSTHYNQQGLTGLVRLEYRLRTLNFAVEYRHNNDLLQYGGAPLPTTFRGNQYRFSLTRQFGFGL